MLNGMFEKHLSVFRPISGILCICWNWDVGNDWTTFWTSLGM